MIHADGMTDNYDAIQLLLDAAYNSPTNKRVNLPAGDILISHPLRVREGVRLSGSRDGVTRLFGAYGSGHLVACMSDRPFHTQLGESLVTGPGAALKLGHGVNTLNGQVVVTTEPGVDCSQLNQFTLRYFFRRYASARPYPTVHVNCGANFGVVHFNGWGVWDNGQGGLWIKWGGNTYTVPNACQHVDITYYMAVTFAGGIVKVWIGEVGGQAQLALQFTSPPTVPMKGYGVETLSFGMNVNGPTGDLASHDGPEAWIDGFEIASTARHDAPFTVPTSKPTCDNYTRLSINFERDDIDPTYLVGHVGYRGIGYGKAYIIPDSPEVQRSGYEVSDITFMGAGGASGPLFYDCIKSRMERCHTIQTWFGYTIRGTTFACSFYDMSSTSNAIAWCQTEQSMQTFASALRFASPGIIMYLAGSVGGNYNGVALTPLAPSLFASIYVYGSEDFNIYGGQVNDEGVNGNVQKVIICNHANLKLNGLHAVRNVPGPVIECCNGGSVQMVGCCVWQILGPAVPLIHLHHQPLRKATAIGTSFGPPNVADSQPMVNNVEWFRNLNILDAQ